MNGLSTAAVDGTMIPNEKGQPELRSDWPRTTRHDEAPGVRMTSLPQDTALLRVYALTYASDDGTEYEHNGHPRNDGEPECPACWAESIRHAMGLPT